MTSIIRHGEPSQRERAENWRTAIGLQAVDGLKPSAYLLSEAQRNIEDELTIDEVRENLRFLNQVFTDVILQSKQV